MREDGGGGGGGERDGRAVWRRKGREEQNGCVEEREKAEKPGRDRQAGGGGGQLNVFSSAEDVVDIKSSILLIYIYGVVGFLSLLFATSFFLSISEKCSYIRDCSCTVCKCIMYILVFHSLCVVCAGCLQRCSGR